MKLVTKLFIILSLFCVITITNANAQFGKNKVQYQKYDWKYIETKYFDVYYDAGSKPLADFTAIAAEKALNSIQKSLGFKINSKIPIIVYDSHNQFQQNNIVDEYMSQGIGGVTEMFKNRVVLPFAGDYNQFRHVIHHELVHAVLNQMLYGGNFQTSLQTGPRIEFPTWMNEGLAEWESYGGLNTETDMFMRDVSLSENLRNGLKDLDGYYAYRGGQTFYWFIAQNYGDEKVGDLVNRIKNYGGLNTAFNLCFNMKFEDFSDYWVKELKKYYWPDIQTFQDPEDYAQRITNHKKEYNFYNSSPAISPNGKKLAYISDVDGLFALFVRDIDGPKNSKPRKLVTSLRKQDFEELSILTPGLSWNPDGTKLVISGKSGGEDAIYIMDEKTGDYDKIKLGFKTIVSVIWSPDGKSIAFIASDKEKSDIFIYSLESQKVRRITNDVFTESAPAWSHDSKRIFFISNRGNNLENSSNSINLWKTGFEGSDIYSIDVESGQIVRITNEPQYEKTSLAVSADNNKVLYVSDKNGIGNIYQIDLRTKEIKPKTNSLTGITQLSLNADDSKLVFTTLDKAGYDIFMIKFPFDKNLAMDTLPLTKFRQKQLEKSQNERMILTADSNTNVKQKLQGYGKFSVDLSKQNAVQANKDVFANNQNNEDNTSDDVVSGDNTPVYPEKTYKLKFTADLVSGDPAYSTYYGFQGVGQIMFSDILGDNRLYFQADLYRDLNNSNFLAEYLYLPNIIDYDISLYHNAGYAQLTTGDYYRLRNYGLILDAKYPFDLFNRVEAVLTGMNVSKTNVTNTYVTDEPTVSRWLIVPELKYVHDDVLYGYFAPVRGSRWYVDFKGTPKLSKDAYSFVILNGDYRRYIPIVGDYINLALRGAAGASFGPNPRSFYLGGTENWINSSFNFFPFTDPEDFAFMNMIMPLRGWDIGAASGTRYFMSNAELRFPLFQALIAGPVPLLFNSVMGSFFYDIAGAWNGDISNFCSVQKNIMGNNVYNLCMSAGIGIRSYVLGIPVKLDIAWANYYYAWSKPKYMFSLGYDF